MRQWFDFNPEYFRAEKDAVTIEQPGMVLEKAPAETKVTLTHRLKSGRAICHGTYLLRVPDSSRVYEYSITIITSPLHPEEMPVLCSNDPKLPAGNLDRHIMSGGVVCLGIGAELKRKWRPEKGLVGFFHDFVSPFLTWQVYYDVFGHAPPTGERSHGAKGILEFYAEEIGLTDFTRALGFMKLLAKKNRPKGHLPCPCGSELKLRDCHGRVLWRARETLKWQHVLEDIRSLKKGKSSENP